MTGFRSRFTLGGRHRSIAIVGLAVGLAVVASAVSVRVVREPPRCATDVTGLVFAERGGIQLPTTDLSGRVSLVAPAAGVRWRIVGLTAWQRVAGRVLVSGWDTATVADGAYRIELRTARGTRTQNLTVRNVTPLPGTWLASASAGLSTRPVDYRSVVAVFQRRSYRPGETALLTLWGRYSGPLRLQLLRIGPDGKRVTDDETVTGAPVGRERVINGAVRAIRVRLGAWQSGLYAARLRWRARAGFALFVLRPRTLGRNPVAIVQPTNTWQAYNYRCANGDGVPDTWYATQTCTTVSLSRPYLDRGVPPHFRAYDLGFLRWLWREDKRVDMLAQEDIERIPGDRLHHLYRLIIFPGHHEYVTTAEYDAVQRYRDLGGHLAFLSANNFFYRVDRRGDTIVRMGRWRDLGRPEAALVGVQYFTWNSRKLDAQQYVVRGARAEPWFFASSGLRNGDLLGWWGIEVDGRTTASPPSVQVLAEMPHALGTTRPAEMTYYETAAGARVFAAGAFTLGGDQAMRWTTRKLLDNLWARLAAPARASDISLLMRRT
jgi:hypothetical protein